MSHPRTMRPRPVRVVRALNPEELRAEGYTLPELNCGFTIAELKAAGVSAAEFVAASWRRTIFERRVIGL